MTIYLVYEHYNNGGSYEDNMTKDTLLKCFRYREDAVNFIRGYTNEDVLNTKLDRLRKIKELEKEFADGEIDEEELKDWKQEQLDALNETRDEFYEEYVDKEGAYIRQISFRSYFDDPASYMYHIEKQHVVDRL